jgi:hypothetical protein
VRQISDDLTTFNSKKLNSNRNGDDGIDRLFTSNPSHYTTIVISASLLSRTRPQSKKIKKIALKNSKIHFLIKSNLIFFLCGS